MELIFASKLYRASKNKGKIRAAISNPINAELIQQLSSYLQVPVVDEDNVLVKDEGSTEEFVSVPVGDANQVSSTEPDEYDSMTHTSTSFQQPSYDAPPLTQEVTEELSEPNPDEDVSDIPESQDAAEHEESEVVEESTSVKGTSIQAATEVGNACCFDGDVSIDSIKGLINARADTAGVSYGIIKGNELWLYYDDSINLNDVMAPVIELLNAAAYTYLEFNRLARSDNAIVFEIVYSAKQVQPIGESSEEE